MQLARYMRVRVASGATAAAGGILSVVEVKPLLARQVSDESAALHEVGVTAKALNPFSYDVTEGQEYDAIQDVSGYWILVGGASEATPAEPNPGVVAATIVGRSKCTEERAFEAEITSRPFGSPGEMRRERGGMIDVYDPSECLLDIEYEDEDFEGVQVWASLMYGGDAFSKGFNFRATEGFATDGDEDTFVLGDDAYAPDENTLRPEGDCDPFGWLGGIRVAVDQGSDDPRRAGSIGPVVPAGMVTWVLKLPERGKYKVKVIYGDALEPTNNTIVLRDGSERVLATLTGETDPNEEGEEHLQHEEVYEFLSDNRPELRIELSNIEEGKDTRINHVQVTQYSEPSRWEVINRCCMEEDSA